LLVHYIVICTAGPLTTTSPTTTSELTSHSADDTSSAHAGQGNRGIITQIQTLCNYWIQLQLKNECLFLKSPDIRACVSEWVTGCVYSVMLWSHQSQCRQWSLEPL